jgi:hypothetical protein
LRFRGESPYIRGQNCHGGRRNSRNPERVSERVGPDLREALDNFLGKARDAVKRKLGWDSPALVLAGTVNFGFLRRR